MPHSQNISDSAVEQSPFGIVWPVFFSGAAAGFILSWGVLSGDQQGRVNLLYLLLVYLLIPILSVVVSLISLVKGRGINLASLLFSLPFWSFNKQATVRKVHQFRLDKYWFLMQSQAAAIAFSVASLATFFLLLITTDLNFVWRSTILDAADIFSWLKAIAWPWFFWQSAQPDIQLLQMTQDSRLIISVKDAGVYAHWWQFILATQVFYSLLLRSLLFFGCRWWINRSMHNDLEQHLQSQIEQHSQRTEDPCDLSSEVNHLPCGIAVNNWAGTPSEILAALPELNLDQQDLIIAGPTASAAEQSAAERWQGEQLIIVKAWEPPMGELEDFLENSRGYLLPLDWNESGLTKPRTVHLDEWRRLAGRLPNWQLYQPISLNQGKR